MSNMRRHFLRTFFALALGPVLLLGLLLALGTADTLLNEARRDQRVRATALVAEVQNMLSGVQGKLVQAARWVAASRADAGAMADAVAILLADRATLHTAAVIRGDGQSVLVQSNRHWTGTDAARSWTVPAPLPPFGGARFGAVEVAADGEPCITVFVPLPPHQNGDILVLAAELRARALWNLLAQLPLAEGEQLYLVDGEDRVVAHRNPSVVLAGRTASRVSGWGTGLNGTMAIIQTLPVSGHALSVVVENELATVLRPVGRALLLILGVTVLAGLGAWAAVAAAIRTLVQPVQRVAAAAQAVGAGAHDCRVESEGPHEVRLLAENFNRMIAEIRSREAELRASEQRFRGIFEQAAVGMALVGLDGRWLMVNERLAHIVGYSKDELLVRSFQDITHPDDLDRDLEQVRRLLRGEGATYALEKRYLHKNGGVIWITLTVALMQDAAGRPACFVSVIEDISRRRQAEDRLRFAQFSVDKAVDAILWMDRDGRITYVNEAASALLGYDAAELLCLRAADINPAHRGEAWEAHWRILEQERGGVFQTSLRHKDGRMVAVEISTRLLEFEGRLFNVGFVRDITERLAAQMRLEQTVDELTRSNTELERFTYVASHDLQEPVRSVVSFTQMLRRRLEPSLDYTTREYMDFITAGAMRMRALVQDLLTYSRTGNRDAVLRPVELCDVLTVALDNLHSVIDESRARVMVGDLPRVMGDEVQLMEVFQNLIGNAIKFAAPDRPPEIRIGTAAGDGHWRITVADNGLGIDPHYHERVFELFRRLHASATYPGTGIGLALCRRILTRHGGRIWIDPATAEGSGTVIHFTLPMAG